VIQDGQPVGAAKVRKAYERLRPLEKLNIQKRGWTLDVLQAVKGLNKKEFTLKEIYDHKEALAKLHLNNAHVRDKIRQQLRGPPRPRPTHLPRLRRVPYFVAPPFRAASFVFSC
jgi:hypothetical protein